MRHILRPISVEWPLADREEPFRSRARESADGVWTGLGGHPSDQKNDDESSAPVENEYAATPFGPRRLMFRTIEFAWTKHPHLGSPILNRFNFVRLSKKAAAELRRAMRRLGIRRR
jgi:hypothetical protein